MQFNNIQPQSRANRLASKGLGYQPPPGDDARPIPKAHLQDHLLLEHPDTGSTHFEPDQNRFKRNFAAEEQARNKQKHEQWTQKIYAKQEAHKQRDADRWERMGIEENKEEQRITLKRDKQQVGKRNQNSEAYNPITLQYYDTQEGSKLAFQDKMKDFRQAERSKNIYERSNCAFDYNLLTGATKPRVGDNLEKPTYTLDTKLPPTNEAYFRKPTPSQYPPVPQAAVAPREINPLSGMEGVSKEQYNPPEHQERMSYPHAPMPPSSQYPPHAYQPAEQGYAGENYPPQTYPPEAYPPQYGEGGYGQGKEYPQFRGDPTPQPIYPPARGPVP